MSTEQLEQRLTAVEQALADMQQKITALTNGSQSKLAPGSPMTSEEEQAFKDYQAICLYIRKTGQEPPPDWKPGDPIPDPEWWS